MSRSHTASRFKPLRSPRMPETVWSPWPPATQTRAAALFDVQMWLWGRDVMRPEGNLLLKRGFARTAPGHSKDSRTYYQFETNENSIVLWGWGMFYGVEGLGGLFIDRQRFQLSWTTQAVLPTNVWKVEDLRGFCSPKSDGQCAASHLLLREALGWIASYERWIAEATSSDYRRSCLTGRTDWPALSRRIAAELAEDSAAHATAIAWEELMAVALQSGPSNVLFT